MTRKRLVILLLASCLALWAQAQQAPPKLALTPVAEPFYMVDGGGGNIGVVADEAGLVMIDAMFERMAAGVREALQGLPGGDRVRMLIDTHWHSDHTDGNKAFASSAVIIAHHNCRRLLAADQTLMGGTTAALPAAALPVVTYAEQLTIHAGGQAVRLVHFPGAHTNGDTVVFIDGLKVVHMGDMFFNGMFPFLDVAHGGDIENWVRNLDTILAGLPADTKIIPGHGPLGGVAELKAFRDMLAASADHVRKRIAAGRTLEQIQAEGLPAGLEPWAKGFMKGPRWLELVHSSLTKARSSGAA